MTRISAIGCFIIVTIILPIFSNGDVIQNINHNQQHRQYRSSSSGSDIPVHDLNAEATQNVPASHQNDFQSSHNLRNNANEHEHWDIRNNIPGEPDIDYPIYSTPPETSFFCNNRHDGYYADVEARCQVFRVCANTDLSGKGFAFLCPNGTLFNQQHFVCDWYKNVDCSRSENFYSKNDDLGKVVGSISDMMSAVKTMVDYTRKPENQQPQNQGPFNNNNNNNQNIYNNNKPNSNNPNSNINSNNNRPNFGSSLPNNNFPNTNPQVVPQFANTGPQTPINNNGQSNFPNKNTSPNTNSFPNQSPVSAGNRFSGLPSQNQNNGLGNPNNGLLNQNNGLANQKNGLGNQDGSNKYPANQVFVSNLGELSTDFGTQFNPATSKVVSGFEGLSSTVNNQRTTVPAEVSQPALQQQTQLSDFNIPKNVPSASDLKQTTPSPVNLNQQQKDKLQAIFSGQGDLLSQTIGQQEPKQVNGLNDQNDNLNKKLVDTPLPILVNSLGETIQSPIFNSGKSTQSNSDISPLDIRIVSDEPDKALQQNKNQVINGGQNLRDQSVDQSGDNLQKVLSGEGNLLSQSIGQRGTVGNLQGSGNGKLQQVLSGEGSLLSQSIGQRDNNEKVQQVLSGEGNLLSQSIGQRGNNDKVQQVLSGEGNLLSQSIGQRETAGNSQGSGNDKLQQVLSGEGSLLSQSIGQRGNNVKVQQVLSGEGNLLSQSIGQRGNNDKVQQVLSGEGSLLSQSIGQRKNNDIKVQQVLSGEGNLLSQSIGQRGNAGNSQGSGNDKLQQVLTGEGNLLSQTSQSIGQRGNNDKVQQVLSGEGSLLSQSFGQRGTAGNSQRGGNDKLQQVLSGEENLLSQSFNQRGTAGNSQGNGNDKPQQVLSGEGNLLNQSISQRGNNNNLQQVLSGEGNLLSQTVGQRGSGGNSQRGNNDKLQQVLSGEGNLLSESFGQGGNSQRVGNVNLQPVFSGEGNLLSQTIGQRGNNDKVQQVLSGEGNLLSQTIGQRGNNDKVQKVLSGEGSLLSQTIGQRGNNNDRLQQVLSGEGNLLSQSIGQRKNTDKMQQVFSGEGSLLSQTIGQRESSGNSQRGDNVKLQQVLSGEGNLLSQTIGQRGSSGNSQRGGTINLHPVLSGEGNLLSQSFGQRGSSGNSQRGGTVNLQPVLSGEGNLLSQSFGQSSQTHPGNSQGIIESSLLNQNIAQRGRNKYRPSSDESEQKLLTSQTNKNIQKPNLQENSAVNQRQNTAAVQGQTTPNSYSSGSISVINTEKRQPQPQVPASNNQQSQFPSQGYLPQGYLPSVGAQIHPLTINDYFQPELILPPINTRASDQSDQDQFKQIFTYPSEDQNDDDKDNTTTVARDNINVDIIDNVDITKQNITNRDVSKVNKLFLKQQKLLRNKNHDKALPTALPISAENVQQSTTNRYSDATISIDEILDLNHSIFDTIVDLDNQTKSSTDKNDTVDSVKDVIDVIDLSEFNNTSILNKKDISESAILDFNENPIIVEQDNTILDNINEGIVERRKPIVEELKSIDIESTVNKSTNQKIDDSASLLFQGLQLSIFEKTNTNKEASTPIFNETLSPIQIKEHLNEELFKSEAALEEKIRNPKDVSHNTDNQSKTSNSIRIIFERAKNRPNDYRVKLKNKIQEESNNNNNKSKRTYALPPKDSSGESNEEVEVEVLRSISITSTVRPQQTRTFILNAQNTDVQKNTKIGGFLNNDEKSIISETRRVNFKPILFKNIKNLKPTPKPHQRLDILDEAEDRFSDDEHLSESKISNSFVFPEQQIATNRVTKTDILTIEPSYELINKKHDWADYLKTSFVSQNNNNHQLFVNNKYMQIYGDKSTFNPRTVPADPQYKIIDLEDASSQDSSFVSPQHYTTIENRPIPVNPIQTPLLQNHYPSSLQNNPQNHLPPFQSYQPYAQSSVPPALPSIVHGSSQSESRILNRDQLKESVVVKIVPAPGWYLNDDKERKSYFEAVQRGLLNENGYVFVNNIQTGDPSLQRSGANNGNEDDDDALYFRGRSSYESPLSSVGHLSGDSDSVNGLFNVKPQQAVREYSNTKARDSTFGGYNYQLPIQTFST